jgi:hypothetical protein
LLSEPSSEAGAKKEAVMAEAPSRDQTLERILDEKRAQGYRIESHNNHEAVLSMRGRRRFLNLFHGDDVRYLLSFDEQGHSSSRRIELGTER